MSKGLKRWNAKKKREIIIFMHGDLSNKIKYTIQDTKL